MFWSQHFLEGSMPFRIICHLIVVCGAWYTRRSRQHWAAQFGYRSLFKPKLCFQGLSILTMAFLLTNSRFSSNGKHLVLSNRLSLPFSYSASWKRKLSLFSVLSASLKRWSPGNDTKNNSCRMLHWRCQVACSTFPIRIRQSRNKNPRTTAHLAKAPANAACDFDVVEWFGAARCKAEKNMPAPKPTRIYKSIERKANTRLVCVSFGKSEVVILLWKQAILVQCIQVRLRA